MRIDVYHHIVPDEAKVLAALAKLEKLIMTQNESIAALKAAFDAFKTKVSAGLDNIAADEAAILAKLNTLGDLTPANQAIVDSVVTDLGAVSDRIQALADSIPDAPPIAKP